MRFVVTLLAVLLIASTSVAHAEFVSFIGTVTHFEDPTKGEPGIPDLTGLPITITFELPASCTPGGFGEAQAATPLVVGDYVFGIPGSQMQCTSRDGGYMLDTLPDDWTGIYGPGVSVAYPSGFGALIDSSGSMTWSLGFWSSDPYVNRGTISGTGRVATIPAPWIEWNPTELDFGQVVVDGAKWLPLVVSNTGDANLVVYSIGSANPISPPFFVTSDGCTSSTLVPGASCEITVGFSPTTAAEFRDTFSIESNHPYGPGARIDVLGHAVTLGGHVTGMETIDVTCENKTQKVKLQFPLTDTEAGMWDCQAAGLPVRSGDEVTMKVKGVAQ